MLAHISHYGLRADLIAISGAINDWINDDRYELPSWFSGHCERISLSLLTVVDLSNGRFPWTWKAGWLKNFVDRWHQEFEFGPAPYGWTALKARVRSLVRVGNETAITKC